MKTYTDEEINLITLCSFGELTYSQRRMLLSDFSCASPDFVKYEANLIKSLSRGVYNKLKAFYFSEEYRRNVLSDLDRREVACITVFSEDYPERLKNTPCPPVVLYCKGNTELLSTRMFAVVGSRKTLPNIREVCTAICGELTQHFTVVTGMADGADAAAIEGAIPCGRVISVLAHGFNFAYPSVNAGLIRNVERRGLLVTEYAPDVPPKSYHFPVRNRIIAGLAEGALVVSAGEKSGALITADYAVEYGRYVFALPYTVGVSSGAGCNALIKNGGLLVENTLDIFDIFGLDFKPRAKVTLTREEEDVLRIIEDCGEAFVQNIADKLGKQPFMLIPVLSSLEIKGLIARLGGNRYAAVKKK